MLQPLIDSDDEAQPDELEFSQQSDATIQITELTETEPIQVEQFTKEVLNPDEINLDLYEQEVEEEPEEPQAPKVFNKVTSFDCLEDEIICNCHNDYFHLLYQMRMKMKNLTQSQKQASKTRMLQEIKGKMCDKEFEKLKIIFDNYFN